MIKATLCTAFMTALVTSTSVQADVRAKFDEGAPKDRFTLTNTGDCALPAGQIILDLGTAPAGLIFDVTAAGAGVEVFQPFDVVQGADALQQLPRVADGDSAIALEMNGLAAGQSIAFTIDVDDTGGAREITVSGAEIAGASLQFLFEGARSAGTFDANAVAIAKTPACLS